MKTYEVTYEKDGIYHSNLARAKDKEAVEKWFAQNKKSVKIIAIEYATSDSMRPGKPCIEIA